MRDWVDAVLRVSTDGLWAHTFQLGDWLDPSAPPDKPAQAKVDSDIVASAYLARSLRIVADTAALLGEAADAETYGALAETQPRRVRRRVRHPAGPHDVAMRRPRTHSRSSFGLVTDESVRARLAQRLAELVRGGGYRIGTGFVGTPLVTDALTDGGLPRRSRPAAAADREPVVAVPGHDGRDHDLGALGQPAARTARSTPAR